ncbi:MAG TPA: hypothetical protein VE991_06125 [Acidimicrobiales bacterium]|nr:hypothetical protein [Acidimicrobiales bacterium]
MADEQPPLLPTPQAVARWIAALLREVAYAPGTVAKARALIAEVAQFPVHLERIVHTVDRTTGGVERSLDEVSAAIVDVRQRLDHLDAVISDLSRTLTGVIAAIPGARRAIDRSAGAAPAAPAVPAAPPPPPPRAEFAPPRA